MTSAMPAIPPPEAVLTRWERIWYGLMSNRVKIGGYVLGVSTLIRGSLLFKDASRTADVLVLLAQVLMLGGGVTMVTGATHGDKHYEIEKSKTIRSRSGRFAAFDPSGHP